MSILVFGASGFLGRAATERLRSQFDVVTASRGEGGDFQCDLTDPRKIRELLERVSPQTVVNCAVTPNFADHVLPRMMPVNTIATATMAQWTGVQGRQLINVSMAGIFGKRASRIEADMAVAPDSDYAISKYVADELVAAFDPGACTIRFGGIFGARGPAHLALNRAIDAALEGRTSVVFGSGRARRNYIYVRDAANVIADSVVSGRSGVFLCGGAEVNTLSEMYRLIGKVLLDGREPTFDLTKDEADDQIVVSDRALPAGRTFEAALVDIRDAARNPG